MPDNFKASKWVSAWASINTVKDRFSIFSGAAVEALTAAIQSGAISARSADGAALVAGEFSIRDIYILRRDLDAWLKRSVAETGRPTGTGKQTTDAALIERMRTLIKSGKANSRSDAVTKILKEDGSNHGASAEATIRRLRDRYAKVYGK